MTSVRKFIGRWKALTQPLLAAAGVLLPSMALYAASTADVSLTIRPLMQVTPSTVTDLAVTATAQEGQLQLTWTAPAVFPGTTLDSYQVRVATFSLASVGGSTTTWWNASGGFLVQGLYGESPGNAVIRTLGPPGSNHVMGLFPGATYYTAVRSADDIGVGSNYWADAVQVVSGSPLDTPPAVPTGLAAFASTATITLSWTDLTGVQKGLDFDGYRIYRSVNNNTSFVLFASTTGTTYTDAATISGVTYYYRVTAYDRGTPLYPGAILESAPSSIVSSSLGSLGGVTPLRPNGLTMTMNGGQFTFNWHSVTTATNGQSIAIDHYVLYRYDAIGATATLTVPVFTNSYTDTVGGLTFYYRVAAVSVGGELSPLSDYVDSSSALNRYALAPTETDTRVTLPASLAQELNYEFNGTSDDYEIVAIHQPQNENTTTLKAYLFQVQNARTGQIISNFAFSQPIADVQVSYALSGGGVIGLTQNVLNLNNNGPQAQAVAQLISLYWFNGSSYIRVGGTVLLANQALTVSAKNLGLYEIRAISAPSTFALTRGSPYPRVITPNGGENRRVFWFFDNPTGEEVTGTIYDIRGAKVRDLGVNSMSPTANSLVWDGRDDRGSVVPTGVYLYKIQAGKERKTGTVVVAR